MFEMYGDEILAELAIHEIEPKPKKVMKRGLTHTAQSQGESAPKRARVTAQAPTPVNHISSAQLATQAMSTSTLIPLAGPSRVQNPQPYSNPYAAYYTPHAYYSPIYYPPMPFHTPQTNSQYYMTPSRPPNSELPQPRPPPG